VRVTPDPGLARHDRWLALIPARITIGMRDN